MPKIIEKRLQERYPLTREDIDYNRLYESDNGTIVIKLHADVESEKYPFGLVNILNGIGSYTESSKFRLLSDVNVVLETNTYGAVIDSGGDAWA